jgi:hypothetical protein
MTQPKRLVGQGTGRIPYGSTVVDNSSGSFDCAPIIFKKGHIVVALRSEPVLRYRPKE